MISITLEGEARLEGALKQLAGISLIVEEWMRSGQTDEIMDRSFAQNFTSQGIPKWAQLSQDTLDDRKRRGYSSGPILVRTGNLRDEVTNMQSKVESSAESVIATWGIDQMRGEDSVKFAVHQGGTIDIPARPMIGFQNIDGSRLLTSLRDRILIALK